MWKTHASNGHGTCGAQITWVQETGHDGTSGWAEACDYVGEQASTPECAPCSMSSESLLAASALAQGSSGTSYAAGGAAIVLVGAAGLLVRKRYKAKLGTARVAWRRTRPTTQRVMPMFLEL